VSPEPNRAIVEVNEVGPWIEPDAATLHLSGDFVHLARRESRQADVNRPMFQQSIHGGWDRLRSRVPWCDARQVIRNSHDIVMIEPRQQLHVGRGKSGAPTIDGVIDLPPQIFEVLATYPGHGVVGITLPRSSVTGFTQPKVDVSPMPEEFSTADPGR
jgi:hypothetical protein